MKYLFLLFFLFLSHAICAQQIKFLDDSLERQILATNDPLFKADCHNYLGFLLFDGGNKAEAFRHFSEAETISTKHNYRLGLGYALYYRGLKEWQNGNVKDAEKSMIAGIDSIEMAGGTMDLYSPLSAIRLFYNETHQYESKLLFYQKRLDYYTKKGLNKNLGSCYHGIGNYYNISGFLEKAIEYYTKAMQSWNENGNTMCANAMHIVLSQTYNNWGNREYAKKLMEKFSLSDFSKTPMVIYIIYQRQKARHAMWEGDYKSALKHYLGLNELKDMMGEGNTLINYIDIARTYLFLGQADSAKIYIDLVLPEITKNKYSLWNANGDLEYEFYLARYYWLSGNRVEGYAKMKDALASAKAEQYSKLILKYLKELSLLSDSLGNTTAAFNYLTEYNLLNDSIEQSSQVNRIALYETEMKEHEISLLNKDNAIQQSEIRRQKVLRNSFFGGFAIVLLFAGVFLLQRNKIREGKKRSDELLLNILPAEVADELKLKGSAEARQFDQVTVLFTDFKNFTIVSSQLSAQELVKEINYCYSNFDRIITEHGIEKIKTIGDAYMCVGGLPVPDAKHAVKTANAALAIRDFMVEEKRKREDKGQTYFEIRIGLHSGPVVAGIVGIKKFAYDIWGDTVNIASRMESCGEEGKVNVSDTTYEIIKDRFNCVHRGKIEAKNKGLVNMYFVEMKTDNGSANINN